MSESKSDGKGENEHPLPNFSEIRELISGFPEGREELEEYLVSKPLADAIVGVSNSQVHLTFPDVRLLATYCFKAQNFVDNTIDFPHDTRPETGIKKMSYQARIRLLDMDLGLLQEVGLAAENGRVDGRLVLEQYVKSVSWIKEQAILASEKQDAE